MIQVLQLIINRRAMGFAKTLVLVIPVIVLLVSLTSGEGHACRTEVGVSRIVVRKNNNSVICSGSKVHAKCAGNCSSKAIFTMKDGGAHWIQDCECCQPIGHISFYANMTLNCTDGSVDSVSMPLPIPRKCQCVNC